MLKKNNILFFLSIIFIFFSCSNNQNSIITYQNEDTLKTYITEKGNDTLWTKEINPSTLLEDIKKNSLVEVKSLSPGVINVVSNQMQEIYPSIENFANLDTRNLPADLRDFINSFYNQISTDIYNPQENTFTNEFMFSYIFFIEDLKGGWKKYFNQDFPAIEEPADSSEDSQKMDENQNIENKINNDKPKYQLFSSKIYGEPFNSENYIQIPVRLINDFGLINVIIYVTNTSPYSIFNIEIEGWEAKNGKK